MVRYFLPSDSSELGLEDVRNFEKKLIYLQCGAPKIAKLVNITPITMIYGTYNYSIHGVYKPTNITGGAHIVPWLHGSFQ